MREQNGWTDNGSKLRGTENRRCPNCSSLNFRETLSREHCPDCGLECDYWGKGVNPVYQEMMDREYRAEEAERERKDREYWENQQPDDGIYY
jgi:hypothetical protein